MSADKRKPPKRMFKGTDRASRYEVERSPMGRMKRVAREHEDVLQNIEFVLVTGWRDDPRVDDAAALAALQAAMTGQAPDDPRAARLAADLGEVRDVRQDVDDNAWRSALRVVAESVRRHSSLRPGEVEYLRFVEPYVR